MISKPSIRSSGKKLSSPSPNSSPPLMQSPYIILFNPFLQLTKSVSSSLLPSIPKRILAAFTQFLILSVSVIPNLFLMAEKSNKLIRFSEVICCSLKDRISTSAFAILSVSKKLSSAIVYLIFTGALSKTARI